MNPRLCSQWTTGTNFSTIMNSQGKGNKITGAGEIGGPRPGAERKQRVLSASISDDRKGEQVDDQACSSACTTGTRNTSSAKQTGQDTETIISDSSASSGRGRASQPHRGARAKRRKRTRASTTPPFWGATQDSETESEARQTVFRAPAPPPPRPAKRLPIEKLCRPATLK